MDPNLFFLDWPRLVEVLAAIVVMAFILERALALLFDSRFFLEMVEGKMVPKPGAAKRGDAVAGEGGDTRSPRGTQPPGVGRFPIKELIAFAVAASVCVFWRFDAISMVFLKEQTTVVGAVITGGIVAGGSKAAVRLFRDMLRFTSSARNDWDAYKHPERLKRQ